MSSRAKADHAQPVALVTGGTRGIGLEVARGLVAAGFRVLVVGRGGHAGDASTEFLRFDLSDTATIPRLATQIGSLASRLDLLVHNAAIVTRHRELTPEGHELQFTVNHLAVYALTRALIPLLTRTPGARVVVTASQVERSGTIDFDDLMGEVNYSPDRAYRQSKLANVLFTYELARRLAGFGITANCLHPGVVRTNLLETLHAVEGQARPAPGALRQLGVSVKGQVGRLLRATRLRPPIKDWALTPGEGALTTLHAALSPELAGVSGRYFKDCQVAESSPQSQDRDCSTRLWKTSAALLRVSPDWPVA